MRKNRTLTICLGRLTDGELARFKQGLESNIAVISITPGGPEHQVARLARRCAAQTETLVYLHEKIARLRGRLGGLGSKVARLEAELAQKNAEGLVQKNAEG